MKRYWKLIILPAVILVTFMVYYIQPTIAQDDLLELELITNEDTEGLGESLKIFGDVSESQNVEGSYYYENANYNSFELGSNGMIYQDDLNYFERLNHLHSIPKMEQLMEDYRGFMRGKHSIDLLYEDDEVLAYVGPYGQNPENGVVKLDISILEKQTETEENFTLEIPLQGPMHHINIADVQLLDNKLYVLTTHYGEIMTEEFYLYKIDAEEKALEETRHLNDGLEGEIWLVNDFQSIGKKTHYVFRRHENIQEENFETSFVSYHIEPGEMNTVDTPDTWSEYGDTPEVEVNPLTYGNYAIKEDFMYFIRFTEDTMVIEQYNLLENSLASTEELPFDADMIDGLDLVYTDGDKVTLIYSNSSQGKKERSIFIVDLKNTEIVYEGDIEITNTAQEMQVYDIVFYQVHIH